MMIGQMRDPDAQTHAILGAGLAGLSLAVALVRDGVREPIVLIDRRSQHGRDRTWCFWDVRPTPFSALASHRWDRWRVIGEDGTAAVHRSPAHPYLHLDSRALYAAALAELERAPNVHLRLGERVLGIEPGEQLPVVRTERESFAAGPAHLRRARRPQARFCAAAQRPRSSSRSPSWAGRWRPRHRCSATRPRRR